jgi:hypothetical protein
MGTVIRRQDVDTLAAKLEEFARDLPEQERGVLGWVLARARASELELADEDLETVSGGHGSGAPFHRMLEGAAGLGKDSVQTDSVKWTHSFSA